MTYWKDSLLIGVSSIDSQHRKLIGAIDELMEACVKGQGRERIGETLAFVVSYTKEHFADEERVQTAYAYPGMIAHKQLHKQYVSDILNLVKEYEKDGPSVTLVGKLNKSLVDWLIEHISVEDKKIGEHINRNV